MFWTLDSEPRVFSYSGDLDPNSMGCMTIVLSMETQPPHEVHHVHAIGLERITLQKSHFQSSEGDKRVM
jgi:hypothetical protein